MWEGRDEKKVSQRTLSDHSTPNSLAAKGITEISNQAIKSLSICNISVRKTLKKITMLNILGGR